MLQGVAPYVLSASVIVGGIKLIGGVFPFYTDTFKQTADIKNEFDSNGSFIKSEKVYGSYDSADRFNRILYYSKWNKTENGKYERKIISYRIKNNNLTDILYLMNKQDLNLDDVFGEPYMEQIETRYNIDDLDKDESLKVIIYNREKNDYIYLKESVGQNLGISVLNIICFLLSMEGIRIWRYKVSGFDYNSEVTKIKMSYDYIDVKELKKKKKELKR